MQKNKSAGILFSLPICTRVEPPYLEVKHFCVTLFPFETAPSSGHINTLLCPLGLQLIYIPWQAASLSASCCCAHLVLGDPPGRGVDAKLLQRVDDLASRADRDRAVEDKVQMVDAGILGAEEKGTMSASYEGENLLRG